MDVAALRQFWGAGPRVRTPSRATGWRCKSGIGPVFGRLRRVMHAALSPTEGVRPGACRGGVDRDGDRDRWGTSVADRCGRPNSIEARKHFERPLPTFAATASDPLRAVRFLYSSRSSFEEAPAGAHPAGELRSQLSQRFGHMRVKCCGSTAKPLLFQYGRTVSRSGSRHVHRLCFVNPLDLMR